MGRACTILCVQSTGTNAHICVVCADPARVFDVSRAVRHLCVSFHYTLFADQRSQFSESCQNPARSAEITFHIDATVLLVVDILGT